MAWVAIGWGSFCRGRWHPAVRTGAVTLVQKGLLGLIDRKGGLWAFSERAREPYQDYSGPQEHGLIVIQVFQSDLLPPTIGGTLCDTGGAIPVPGRSAFGAEGCGGRDCVECTGAVRVGGEGSGFGD